MAEYLRVDIKKIDNLLFIAGSNAIIRTYEVQISRFVNYFKNIEEVSLLLLYNKWRNV